MKIRRREAEFSVRMMLLIYNSKIIILFLERNTNIDML